MLAMIGHTKNEKDLPAPTMQTSYLSSIPLSPGIARQLSREVVGAKVRNQE